jgi:AraC-like DNA-binding protein
MPRLLYSESPPPGEIQADVDCIWTVTVDPAGPGNPQHWVLPDGCWTLSIGVRPVWYLRLRPPATAPFTAPCTPGECIVGYRFRPGPPPPELLERARRVLRPGQSVAEILDRATEVIRQCAVERDRRVDGIVSLLRKSGGRVTLTRVSDEVGLSGRHIERLSSAYLGLPPKSFARIVRLQAVVRRLVGDPAAPLADVAAEFGYTDQTHMTRDFTGLGRITPGAYRRSLGNVGFVLAGERAAG